MSFLKNIVKHNVLVIGDIMVDSFIYGHGKRLSQEAPVPVVHVDNSVYKLGGACNVAANLVAMGCNADLCGFIGRDSTGVTCKSLLEQTGISCEFLVECNQPTILKTRVICDDQHVVRFDIEKSFSDAIIHKLEKIDHQKYRSVVISDYAKGTITLEVMDFVKKHFSSAFIVVDPKPKNYGAYSLVGALTPNLSEARLMVGDENATPIDCARKIQNTLQCDFVIVTLSEHGVMLYDNGEVIELPAYPISMSDMTRPQRRDVTGAGDTLIAAFVASYCSGLSRKDSLFVANVAAAITVNKIGTEVCSIYELEKELSNGKEMGTNAG